MASLLRACPCVVGSADLQADLQVNLSHAYAKIGCLYHVCLCTRTRLICTTGTYEYNMIFSDLSVPITPSTPNEISHVRRGNCSFSSGYSLSLTITNLFGINNSHSMKVLNYSPISHPPYQSRNNLPSPPSKPSQQYQLACPTPS